MAKSAVRIAALIATLAFGLLGASGAKAQSLALTSPEISEGATIANDQVFKGFGCTGNNVSPA